MVLNMVLRGLRITAAINTTHGKGAVTTAAAGWLGDALVSLPDVWQDVPAGMLAELLRYSLAEPAAYQHLQPSPAMQHFERRLRATEVAAAQDQFQMDRASGGLAASGTASSGHKSQAEVWRQLQRRYGWADQRVRFESLFKPCLAHGLPQCAEVCG